MQTPQPMQRSGTTRAFFTPFSSVIPIASTGQIFRHLPQPTHFSVSIAEMKLEQIVCATPKRFIASSASQQQEQQLQIKLTRRLTFSPNCTRLWS